MFLYLKLYCYRYCYGGREEEFNVGIQAVSRQAASSSVLHEFWDVLYVYILKKVFYNGK
jgi:hypothetical protein